MIRVLREADIPAGMALKSRAGWNQREADWRRHLALEPEGVFAAEHEGRVAGTVATCRLGDVAWIAMMLVDPDLRRRGIGRALMERALAYLDDLGIRSIRLDATPLGRPLYESLGFVAEATILRHRGTPATAKMGTEAGPVAVAPDDPDVLATIDREATGADRSRLIARWWAEDRPAFRVVRPGAEVLGYSWSRPGSDAHQLGPVIAIDDDAGRVLLADGLARLAGRPAIVDIPEGHDRARRLVEAAGLSVSRELTRMTRGAPVAERLDRIWASSGPELG